MSAEKDVRSERFFETQQLRLRITCEYDIDDIAMVNLFNLFSFSCSRDQATGLLASVSRVRDTVSRMRYPKECAKVMKCVVAEVGSYIERRGGMKSGTRPGSTVGKSSCQCTDHSGVTETGEDYARVRLLGNFLFTFFSHHVSTFPAHHPIPWF